MPAALAVVVVLGCVQAARLAPELTAQLAGGEPASQVSGRLLGPISLIPPVVTILLAFLTKEVLSSLLAGGVAGAALVVAGHTEPVGWGGFALNTLHQYATGMVEVISQPDNAAIILLCLCIGGLTNLISRAGGFTALARRMSKHITKPWQAQLMTGCTALAFFFDDYANALITGPVMRPIVDGARVSREKLAFLVDSTAAPVAGIALISSWIAAELAAIQSGFEVLGVEQSAYEVFLGGVPYCFYNIFCLGFIFWMLLTGRDYGPMYDAECAARARAGTAREEEAGGAGGGKVSLFIAVGSILFLVGFAVVGIWSDGRYNALAAGLLEAGAPFSLDTLRIAFGEASTVYVLTEAAMVTALLAAAVALAGRILTFAQVVEAWVEGAVQLLPTAMILALAWALSESIARLGAASYLAELLSGSLPYWLLPSLVFLVCCSVSFSAGSYGCMLMIMPMAVPIAYTIAYSAPGVKDPFSLLCACVASVLAGSIFGDHCSPVTDTTILSAQGAGCPLMDHVKTQMPYALTVAAVATLAGTLPAGLGVSPAVLLPAGLAVLGAILLKFGKRPAAAAGTKMKTEE